MQSDFKPVHLKEANEKLDTFLSAVEQYQEEHPVELQKSLWKRFLELFKTNPFELPEDL